MAKSKIAAIQLPAFANTGGLNRLSTNYHVYELPVGDETKYGVLSYVDDAIRESIMKAGFGEIEAHIEFIGRQIKNKKKYNKKFKTTQHSFDF